MGMLLVGLWGAAQAYDWPEQEATVEEMRMTEPLRLRVPQVRDRGNVQGPIVLKLHVDAEGRVQRAILFKGCGSPSHDMAAIDAIRRMHFTPKLVDGQPVDATLILPLRVPLTTKNPWW